MGKDPSNVDVIDPVDAILTTDPVGAWAACDRVTRIRYRTAIAQLSAWSGRPENEVAATAIEQARAALPDPRLGHVGAWLIAEGRPLLEEKLRCNVPSATRIVRVIGRHRSLLFVMVCGLVTLGLMAAFDACFLRDVPLGFRVALIALMILPVSQYATFITESLTLVILFPPVPLPRFDYAAGIPRQHRSLVVHPVLITSEEDIADIGRRLEEDRAGNIDDELIFVLLSHFDLAETEIVPSDAPLLARLRAEIDRLNAGHSGARSPFVHLHRNRRWNPYDHVWMAWERKRGSLIDLGRLITGGATSFIDEDEGRRALADVQFAITLDADTQLPPVAAHRLVATIAHPLNRPRWQDGRHTAGVNFFAPMLAGIGGPADLAIDPVRHDIRCNFMQDMFGTTWYAGKAIYDIASVHRCLDGMIVENDVLSHDVVEGAICGAAHVSDVVVCEELPADYRLARARMHRWMRGMAQNLRWGLPRVRIQSGVVANPISTFWRWRMFEALGWHMQFTLVTLIMFVGWLAGPDNVAWWAVALMLIPVNFETTYPELPLSVALTRRLDPLVISDPLGRGSPRPPWPLPALRVATLWVRAIVRQTVFALDMALLAVDAYVRALWRQLVTHRGMLEWATAAAIRRSSGNGRSVAMWRLMWKAPACALLMAGALAVFRPDSLLAASPFLLAWFASPQIAVWLSPPPS